jgi:uncharacterized protein (DUF885 family)
MQLPLRPLALSLALSTALLMSGAQAATVAAVPSATTAPAQSISAFFAEFSDAWMRRQPSASTGSRYFDGAEQARLDRQLTPMTAAFDHQSAALARQGLATLAGFDRHAMSDTERVSAELMQWQLQVIVDGEKYIDHDFPLQQMNGANVQLPNLMTVVHPLGNAQDAANYIARLGQFQTRMGEAVQRARESAAKGILPPRFILDETIGQMRQFIASAPAKNPLVTTLDSKLQSAQGVDAAQRKALVAQATRIVAGQVYPAWQQAIVTLEMQRGKANDDAGAWHLPDGDAYYRYQLRRFTSTDLSPQQIHEIGLREVARIEGEMDRILKSIGRDQGSVQERIAQLEKDQAYANDDAGRKAIMADIDSMIADAQKRSVALFDIVPKSEVIARPYPEFRWKSAAASYTAPPLDGSRPGVFQMPLRPERLTRFGLRTLVYHETVPGHHFQIALSVENKDVPKFRQTRAFGGISAFSEGWALYAERLAAENGWYEGDPTGLLGQLDAELFRARRLVVDTGLHAMKWTRQQAIDYGIERSEVDRYVVFPGQATSYKIGQLEIIRLRDKARAALGDRFDPRQFHNRVLLTGTVPLPLLEREVDAWVAQVKGAAG